MDTAPSAPPVPAGLPVVPAWVCPEHADAFVDGFAGGCEAATSHPLPDEAADALARLLFAGKDEPGAREHPQAVGG